MVFKRKFFLDLSGDGAEPTPAMVAPVKPAAPPASAEAPTASAAPKASEAPAGAEAPATATAGAAASSATGLTTAEAIAAELAAAQASRPAPTLATFAPDCVTAGGAVPVRRRRAGANLAGFKAMAKGMMKS